MLASAETISINVESLESKLQQQKDPRQRLVLLDQLSGHYAYTNPLRATCLLQEQQEILGRLDLPDFQLNYYLHLATVQNQRYDYIQSEQTFRTAISLLEDRGSVKELAEVCIDYAGTCINLEKMDDAAAWLEKASRLLKNFPDNRLMGRITCRRGFMALHYGNYPKAIQLFLEADRFITSVEASLELKDYYFLTLVHSGLGKVYERNDDYEKCVRAYRKVIKMCDRWGIRSRLSWHYLNLGAAYLAMDDQENAERYFRRTMETSDDLSRQARAGACANLGYCYFENGRYDEALELFDRAEHDYKELSAEDYYNFSVIASWRGRLYAELGDTATALQNLNEAYNYASKTEDYKQLAAVCQNIASLYADQEDYRRAYDYQLQHDSFTRDYIEQVDKRRQAELEVKYEAAKKQQEAELLQLQATRLQLKALRAQMNPHFLYNALNSIQSYITGHDVSSASKYLAKFAKLMRQSLEYSDLEIISLEKEVEFLEDYLYINEKLRFEDRLSYKIRVDDDIEEDILGVPTMIVQPYVENAIEHGLRSKKDGMVKVSFELFDDDTILCVVEDNGIGREKARQMRLQDPRTQNHRSRGTHITEKRLEILHQSKDKGVLVRTIDLKDEQTNEAKGTRVEIKIPIVEIHVK